MKITKQDSSKAPATINGFDIPVGTVFDGKFPTNSEGPFLRVPRGIVSLVNLRHTWTNRAPHDHPTVNDYQPLDVELIVHGPQGPSARQDARLANYKGREQISEI